MNLYASNLGSRNMDFLFFSLADFTLKFFLADVVLKLSMFSIFFFIA